MMILGFVWWHLWIALGLGCAVLCMFLQWWGGEQITLQDLIAATTVCVALAPIVAIFLVIHGLD